MKKCVLGLLCACIFSIVIIGCNKNDRSTPKVAVVDSLPGNPKNPYDSFGYWHNVILDSLDYQQSVGKCKSPETYCKYVAGLCKRKSWPSHKHDHFKEIPATVLNFLTDTDGFIDRLNWSDSVKSKTKVLFKRLESVATGVCSYQKLKAIITGFEQEILESDLPPFDKEVLLKASSTARYSGYRWSKQPELTQEFSPADLVTYYQKQDPNKTIARATYKQASLFKRVGRWLAVTGIDITGALLTLSLADAAEVSGYGRLTMELLDRFK